MYRLILIIISVLIVSCDSKEISVPDDVIPKEKMVQVLADIHIAEATVNYKSVGDTVKPNIENYYSDVFKKHSITQDQYRKSYQFYLDNPSMMNKMYDEVINELSRRQSEVQNP